MKAKSILRALLCTVLASVIVTGTAGCGGNEKKNNTDNKDSAPTVSESSEAEEESFRVTTVNVREMPFDKEVFGDNIYEETDTMKIITIAAESLKEPDDKINYITVNIVEPPIAAPVNHYVSDIYPVIDKDSQKTKGFVAIIMCPGKYNPSNFKINYQHKDYFTHSTLSDTAAEMPDSLISDGQTTPYSIVKINDALYYRDIDRNTEFTISDDSTDKFYEASLFLFRLDGTTGRHIDASKFTYEPADDVAKDENYSKLGITFANEDIGVNKSLFAPISQSVRFTVTYSKKDIKTDEESEAITRLAEKLVHSGHFVYDGKTKLELA